MTTPPQEVHLAFLSVSLFHDFAKDLDKIFFSDRPTSRGRGLRCSGRCCALQRQLPNPQLWLPGLGWNSNVLPLGKSSCWGFKGLDATSENSSLSKLDQTARSRKESLRTTQQVDLFESCMMVADNSAFQSFHPDINYWKTFLSAYRVGCYNNSDGSLLESMVCIKDFGQDLNPMKNMTDPFQMVGELGWKQ